MYYLLHQPDACFLTETGLVQSKYLGVQRQFLAQLQSLGPETLVEPGAMYNVCLYAGLLPRHTDSSSLQVRTLVTRTPARCHRGCIRR